MPGLGSCSLALGLHLAAVSRGGFVYLFCDYMYELPEFMRPEVK